jgi:hypothetical protein
MGNNNPNKLFIFGMFRSGTTLLARMLHTHDEIACASDPFRPFFNYFRYEIATETEVNVNPYDPLGDYFADSDELDLFRTIQESTLERPFPGSEKGRLKEKIISHAEPFSPKITDHLDTINGESFKQVYNSLLSNISHAYGSGSESWLGSKEVWSTEFVPPVAESYLDSKFILMVRDPRAVVASKNVQEDTKYPWLFLIRQWRKLAILTWLYRHDPKYTERVLVVRYEDLVQSPESTANRMCEFLDLDVDEDILDPGEFRDGHGDLWLQNTSYADENERTSFNTDSVDKWKNVLDDRTIEFVEQLCFAEMGSFDYQYAGSGTLGLSAELVSNPPTVPFDELAEWIQSYEEQTVVSQITDIGIEQARQHLLSCSNDTADRIDTEVIEAFFLDKKFWQTAREQNI